MPETTTRIINQRVYRAPAVAAWKYEHRWGRAFGGTTSLIVHRTDGGQLEIQYGEESIAIREELVQVLADMVTAAATWTDEVTR